MNILLLGSGGREHSLVKSLYESSKNKKIFCAPGNPGIEEFAKLININISNNDEVLELCIAKKIGLEVHAGHWLTFESAKIVSKIDQIVEFNIGHSIIAESLFNGLKYTIKKFKKIINR